MATNNGVNVGLSGATGTGNFVGSTGASLVTPTTLGVQQSALDMNSHQINNLTDPSGAQDAASKAYVDAVATGLNIQAACVCASTTALTVTYANGSSGVGATLTNAGAMVAISLDGVSPTVGQRVLIKNQASSLQNGIYTVTTVGSGAANWVLTRATDFDTPAEIQPGDFVAVTGGTTQSGSSWLQTATVTAVGTDAITFIQFSASIPVNVASGGTGDTSLTAYAVLCGGTTSTGAVQSVASVGTSGQILTSNGAGALPTFQTLSTAVKTVKTQQFTSNGTYTPSAGMLYCQVVAVGGGGGGGGCATGGAGTCGSGGGGGGGGTAIALFSAATIGASQTVTIGAGGTAGAAAAGNAGSGGNTTFGALLTANGGGGGNGFTATASAGYGGGNTAGGTATGGDLNIKGGQATFPVVFAAGLLVFAGIPGNNQLYTTSTLGNLAQNNDSSPGVAPTAGQYGLGATGACVAGNGASAAGAAGTGGIVYVIEYCNQ